MQWWTFEGKKKETEIKKKKLGDGKKRGLNEKKAP
jgi:hypothetical protein